MRKIRMLEGLMVLAVLAGTRGLQAQVLQISSYSDGGYETEYTESGYIQCGLESGYAVCGCEGVCGYDGGCGCDGGYTGCGCEGVCGCDSGCDVGCGCDTGWGCDGGDSGCGCEGVCGCDSGCGCDVGCGCDTGWGCDGGDSGCGCDGGYDVGWGWKGGYGGCCSQGGFTAKLEGTVFQYDRADGSRVGDGGGGQDDEIFDGDYFLCPRITLGYQSCCGLGFRTRWWEYDNSTFNAHPPSSSGPPNNSISVDTYTIDMEIFDTFSVCNWDFDISAGVRYNEFEELLINTGGGGLGSGPGDFESRINAFSGFGGVLAVGGVRHVTCCSSLYLGCRGAMLVDDKTVFNLNNGTIENDEVLGDSTQGMIEAGCGFQYSRSCCKCNLSFRTGVEWQLWYNYSSAFAVIDDESNFGGSSDVDFFGYTFSSAITY